MSFIDISLAAYDGCPRIFWVSSHLLLDKQSELEEKFDKWTKNELAQDVCGSEARRKRSFH